MDDHFHIITLPQNFPRKMDGQLFSWTSPSTASTPISRSFGNKWSSLAFNAHPTNQPRNKAMFFVAFGGGGWYPSEVSHEKTTKKFQGNPCSLHFWGWFHPYIEGLKPSFFMVLGSKGCSLLLPDVRNETKNLNYFPVFINDRDPYFTVFMN